MEKIRQYNFKIDQYDNDPFVKSLLLKCRPVKTRPKKIKQFDRREAIERNHLFRSPQSLQYNSSTTENRRHSLVIRQQSLESRRIKILKAPIPVISKQICRKIENTIPKRFNQKYAASIKSFMSDVSNHYNETIKAFNIHRFGSHQPEVENVDESSTAFRFKQSGRTEYHSKFLRNRRILSSSLFTPYPFIRFILHSSHQRFPQVLLDFSGYRKTKSGIRVWLTLDEFERQALRDLETNAIFLREEWYPKCVQILAKHYRQRSHRAPLWPRIFNCAKGLINRQINQLKLNTFEHIFTIMRQRAKMPPLQFQAIYTNGHIALNPPYIEISRSFQRILKSVAAVGTKCPPLEPLIDRHAYVTNENYLKIELGDVTFNEILRKLDVELHACYEPILQYVESLGVEFYDLYGDETRQTITNALDDIKSIDCYFEQITDFHRYISIIQKTARNRIFDNAIIDQHKALIGLRTIAHDFIDEIVQRIVDEHQNDCQRICDWFGSVRKRALEAPKSTEALLDNGEFMLEMKNKKIGEIQDHILKNLQISNRLIDLKELSDEHVELQCSMIHWLHCIHEIFEQNASQFETYKNQFEEHLASVTRKLNIDIEALLPKLAIIDDMYDTAKLHCYKATLDGYMEEIKCFEDYAKWINKEEKLFKLPVLQYPIIDSLKDFVNPFYKLIGLCIEWLRNYYIWMDGPFEYLESGKIERLVKEYSNEFDSTRKYYRNRIKSDMLGNPTLTFRGQTEDPDPEKHPVPLRLCGKMIDWLDGFRIGVSIVRIMCNPALRARHWQEMSQIAKFDITPDAGTTLRKITKFNIEHLLPSFEIISIGANKELKLQMDLAEMIRQWETMVFPIDQYRNADIPILGNIEDIQIMIDDHIIKTLAMRGSAFVKPFEVDVRNWYDKLMRVNRIFDEWMKVQNKWLYLLPILSSDKDVSAELPDEQQLFKKVNEIYCKYVDMAINEPIIMKMVASGPLLEDLSSANEMLDVIKIGVNTYLERKRLIFTRFFFLSNDEMLNMLSEAKNPQKIQPYMNRCFSGIGRLNMTDEGDVHGIESSAGEQINFTQCVSMVEAGSIEKWLLEIESQMQTAVRNEVINSYADYVASSRLDWCLRWPQMIVLAVANIFWSSEVSSSMLEQHRDSLQTCLRDLQSHLAEATALIRSPNLSDLARQTLRALCITDLYTLEVTQMLIDNQNIKIDDFQWIAQLRYYWIDGTVVIKMLNSIVQFGYEYVGNFERMIMTPLTERCYHTVFLAFQHHLNASIEGPTAVGKTETIKDLARIIAVQFKLFHCTAELHFTVISKFLKGIVASGAWLCFEDFDRIKEETLSIVAQYIRHIHMAKQKKATKFNFDGVEMNLNLNCGIFIMSSPNYGLFSKLPDNLKVLFRPITMMQPDWQKIVEISLCSSGLRMANSLAKKITELYKMCSNLFAPQKHYDFGLRNLDLVLDLCQLRVPDESTTKTDTEIVYQALFDVNLPKLNAKDEPAFQSMVDDMFGTIELSAKNLDFLRDAFELKCNEKNYQPIESLFEKVIEVYELSTTRHGLILVGNPYTGKSLVLGVLAIALANRLELNADGIVFVNPKAIDLKYLFGHFDPTNVEWMDGIVSSTLRHFATESMANSLKWLVFDGPMHMDWIENLNTVLDDNRKLCLSSGEVLHLTENTLIIFETNSLSEASPSTISRVGIVYFEPDTLDWQTLAKSWISQCDGKWLTDYKCFVWDLLNWVFPPMIEYVVKYGVNIVEPLKFGMVKTSLDLIQMVLDNAVEANAEEYHKFLNSWIQAAAIYGITWGLGGLLNDDSRRQFDLFHRKFWSGCEEFTPPTSIKNRFDTSLPNEGYLYDYYYVFKQKGSWKLWADLVRRLEPEANQYGVHVTTVDSARYSHFIDMHIKYGRSFLLIGPPATGKTYLMQNALRTHTTANRIMPISSTFSICTKAKDVQNDLLTNLLKLKRGVYGPPSGMKGALFVDNLNVPVDDRNESHATHELIRQILDSGYIYDARSTSKIRINNVLALVTCGSISGRYQTIDTRLLNQFNCFAIGEMCDETMNRIFSGILFCGYKKSGHANDVIGNVNQIVSATVSIWAALIDHMKPTPTKPHYRFSMRDIHRVCTGCALLRKESVENKKMFLRVWFHETNRVFQDRLIDAEEQLWLFDRMCEQINDTNGAFKDSMDLVFEMYADEKGVVQQEGLNSLMFGTYLDMDTEVPLRKYEEIVKPGKLAQVAQTILAEYNETAPFKMNFIWFTYALNHLNRICRIISMPAGNGLLIGAIDSGRKTLVRLAVLVCRQKLFEPQITPTYGIETWRNDIKCALKSAGGLGLQTVLLLHEHQLIDEAFYIDIDYLLNSGDIPNLWPIDEKQELLEMVRLVAQGGNRNIDISASEVFSFFVNRCHQNLHIILCFDWHGSNFRHCIRKYPSFIDRCTIDVFTEWPIEAMEKMARQFIADLEVPEELSDALIAASIHLHDNAKSQIATYSLQTKCNALVTSATFLELLRCFVRLYKKRRIEVSEAKSRYVSGLATLQNAAVAVEKMQIELSELRPKLLEMADNCTRMTREIESKTLEASLATEQVKRDEVVANVEAAAALEIEDECSRDLAQAVPVLEEALQALNTLKPSDITLVKSMKNPPSAVKLVMAAVCVMKAVPPDRINDATTGKKIIDYWGPSKRILGDIGFLQSLKDFDKDDIGSDIMRKIRKDFIPHKDFQPHVVAKASSAAEGLCKWVKAIENFETVNAVVMPKKVKLLKAKDNLKEMRKYLAQKRALAIALEEKIDGLNAELDKTNAEKEQTELEVDACERKLLGAETLIRSLGKEKSHWTEKASQLQEQLDNLAGDILLSSGMIAYLGVLPHELRSSCIDGWLQYLQQQNVSCSPEFNVVSCVGNQIEIQNWHIHGLPTDQLSIENAIIMMQSFRQCLFIDPQMQASKWIRKLEKLRQLKVVKQSDTDCFDLLVESMESGNPVLIEDVNEPLHIALNEIINYRITKQNHRIWLHSDLNVFVSDAFHLYIISNMSDQTFLDRFIGKINVINYVFISHGLEESLLDVLALKENPYLRDERDQLIAAKLRDKALMKQYEDAILTAIAECDGEILEDTAAIAKMDDSKQLFVEIQCKQPIYIEAEHKIHQFRENYRAVSSYATTLYSCLDHLRWINSMYRFSLDWFLRKYIISIEMANRSQHLHRRIAFLKTSILKHFYDSVCRSLYNKDKLLFSWIIVTEILLAENRLTTDQMNFFLSTSDQLYGPFGERPGLHWLSDQIWTELNQLANILQNDQLCETFLLRSNAWELYFRDRSKKIPIEITSIEKLLITRIVHPEHLIESIIAFIESEFGASLVTWPQFDIHKSYDESNLLTPLIFLLSPAIDPLENILLFAERSGFLQSMQILSMAACQVELIETSIIRAQTQGSWICIQNCHLNTEWLGNLEKLWKNVTVQNTSSSFRMWMTSNITPTFPLNLLQNAVKITYEKPEGFRSTLLQMYKSDPLNSAFYDNCPQMDKHFKQLLYATSLFDVILNGRKQYAHFGWNIDYEFSHSDFVESVRQLQHFLSDSKCVPFDTLEYVIGECFYGARVIDVYDKRLLKTIFKKLFNQSVLDDPFYCLALDNTCVLPRRFEHRMIVKHIEDTLPVESYCGLYGLHSNSDYMHKMSNTQNLLDSMRISSNLHMLLESGIDVSSYLSEIIEKLPNVIDMADVSRESLRELQENQKSQPTERGQDNFISVIHCTEIEKYNLLITTIHTTCYRLCQAIKGQITFDVELEDLLNDITLNKLPSQWLKCSYPSHKNLSQFLEELCSRFKWFEQWWFSNCLPTSYWISAFFHPHSFIAGIRLLFSRQQCIPIEEISLDYTVTNRNIGELERDKNAVFIHGLYLEGAHWNGLAIDEQLPFVPFQLFPAIRIQAMLTSELMIGDRYECPVYYTSDRDDAQKSSGTDINTIFAIYLPIKSGTTATQWIERGVILCCENSNC